MTTAECSTTSRNAVKVRHKGFGRKPPTTIPSGTLDHLARGSHDTGTFAIAIGYLRVSTDRQGESGLGLEAQRASLVAAAERLGLDLQAVSVDVEHGDVSVTDRPGLAEAVSALPRGGVLLVAKRDRLGREVFEVAMIERLVRQAGARIVSAAGEGTDNEDAPSVLMRRMIDAFAEYERLIIAARTKAALAVKKTRGERIGGVPFGSQLAADLVHLEPAPIEQRLLKRVQELNAFGRSLRQIAADVNAEGWTTRKGTPWRFQYVARALKTAGGAP